MNITEQQNDDNYLGLKPAIAAIARGTAEGLWPANINERTETKEEIVMMREAVRALANGNSAHSY